MRRLASEHSTRLPRMIEKRDEKQNKKKQKNVEAAITKCSFEVNYTVERAELYYIYTYHHYLLYFLVKYMKSNLEL